MRLNAPRISRGQRIAPGSAHAGIPVGSRGTSVLQTIPILLVAHEGHVSLLSCGGRGPDVTTKPLTKGGKSEIKV